MSFKVKLNLFEKQCKFLYVLFVVFPLTAVKHYPKLSMEFFHKNKHTNQKYNENKNNNNNNKTKQTINQS